MLLSCLNPNTVEAGCDEAGRGCLAGDVFAAAVILPPDFRHPVLNDSKQLSAKQRYALRPLIEQEAVAWAVATATPQEIDRINILNASILAMHRAVALLPLSPQHLLIDGPRFKPCAGIPYTAIPHGDALYLSIAAASVLAKTYRDDYMTLLSPLYPHYGWQENKGYPTRFHRQAILRYGLSPLHRLSFNTHYPTLWKNT
ncbi:MAG: ribonuclease HII [Tannerellaceae bacterium]|jgi:ribonuclease HII|nr:ribonuclease HII [Tannerellaceae bacterium]